MMKRVRSPIFGREHLAQSVPKIKKPSRGSLVTKTITRGLAAERSSGKHLHSRPASILVDDLLRRANPPQLDLALSLVQDIRDGKYVVGGRLPTETELCKQSGLSRYAVRGAVQKLCDLGFVTRRAGIGTKVVSSQPQSKYTQVMDTLGDLTRYAESTKFLVKSRKSLTIGHRGSEQVGLPPGSKWFHIHGLRFAEDNTREAIALVDIYVAPDFVFESDFEQSSNSPVYKIIEQKYGVRITRVDQEIQGALISSDAAYELQVTEGLAGLRIVRSYYVGLRLVEKTIGLHPASRFSYAMTFNLNHGHV
jgi:DNA-binding GntR family transcriptional regulator